jgi:hypothetical protein
MTSADTCRSRGWVVGDVIVGTSSTGHTEAWRVTAIGDELVCKRTVATLGRGGWRAKEWGECLGDLSYREWELVAPEQWALIHQALATQAREQTLQDMIRRLAGERDEAFAELSASRAREQTLQAEVDRLTREPILSAPEGGGEK